MKVEHGHEIVVLQLKASNHKAVSKYFKELGFLVESATVERFRASPTKTVILPGVGSFGAVMTHLRDSGCAEELRAHVDLGGSLIGICLGMHLLFASSEETPGIDGLAIFNGTVRFLGDYINANEVPEIGWDSIDSSDPDSPEAYFAHSYFVDCDPRYVFMKRCSDGHCYPSVVKGERVLGIQFHPERSRGNADFLILQAINDFSES